MRVIDQMINLIRSYCIIPCEVNGISMNPTLQRGDRFIINKAAYLLNKPKRGDIIVFYSNDNKYFVKRVIAIENEILEYKNDQLYIDKVATEEPYLFAFRNKSHLDGKLLTNNFGPIRIPKGKIFVMGDNRLESWDSRKIGAVSLDKLVGKMCVKY